MRGSAILAGAALVAFGMVAIAARSAAQAAPEDSEAPVAIAALPSGHWQLSERTSRQESTLFYEARVYPNLSLHLVRFRCEYPGNTRVEVSGLLPAQRFPQPALSLRIGPSSWSATPNALYHGRSQPHFDSAVRMGKVGTLRWPGYPPYATLSFFDRRRSGLQQALATGAPVEVEFEGQRRSFPAVPADLAARFERACPSRLPGESQPR